MILSLQSYTILAIGLIFTLELFDRFVKCLRVGGGF
jgi:hypothetical protein